MTQLGFRSGTSDSKAKLFFIPMTMPGLPVSSQSGELGIIFPTLVTHSVTLGVFAASKTQDHVQGISFHHGT